MAPFLDKAKVTKKQHVEVNINPFSNLKRIAPNKLTSYDPNDVARTTIKETTIDIGDMVILKEMINIMVILMKIYPKLL